MTANMMMRVKDQVLIVLADYQSCKRDEIDERLNLDFDREVERVSREIAKRVMSNYAILAKKEASEPWMDEARSEIEVLIAQNAKLRRDPWAACRHESVRIQASYAIARIIETKAGKKHKFSVWSATIYSATKLIKMKDHRGAHILIAAPSKKKAVEMINEALGGNENLGWANGHWSGGGTVGNQVATKVGIWLGKSEYCEAEDYNLIWEPKP